MNPQQSIFDDSFDQSLKVDRKQLLSAWIKMYLCVIFLLGIWTIIYRTYYLVYNINSDNFPLYGDIIIGNYLLVMITAAAWLLMAYYVLKGRLWAIRFNIWVAILWAVAAGADKIFTLPYNPPSIQSFLLFVPYWVMLLFIRKQWEQ